MPRRVRSETDRDRLTLARALFRCVLPRTAGMQRRRATGKTITFTSSLLPSTEKLQKSTEVFSSAQLECAPVLCVTLRVLCDCTGYYARVTAIYNLVREFIKFGRERGKEVQVISLGAGSDTTFWRLEEEGLLPAQYVEVDLEDVVRRKCHIIK